MGFQTGDKFGRVVFLRDYAKFIKDNMVPELCDFNQNMMMSIDIISIPTDEDVREVKSASSVWKSISPTGSESK